jgi:hypothetical protein
VRAALASIEGVLEKLVKGWRNRNSPFLAILRAALTSGFELTFSDMTGPLVLRSST